MDLPLCVLCPGKKKLSNATMDRAKLRKHQEKHHPETVNKGIEYFENAKKRKLDELSLDEISQSSDISLNQKLTIVSYHVAQNVAKFGISYKAGEEFLRKTLNDISSVLFQRKEAEILSKLPISRHSTSRRIAQSSKFIEEELLQILRQAKWFAIQLDESTDVSNNSVLLVFVRYRFKNSYKEELLLCRNLTTTTTGLDVFNLIDDYFQENGLKWSQVTGVSTDGAPSMVGPINGFKAHVLKVS